MRITKPYLRFFLSCLIIYTFSHHNPSFSKNKIILLSIPKCGTHLLIKTVEAISGYNTGFTPPGICLFTKNTLEKIDEGGICRAHGIYIPENIEVINDKNYKTFFILRDPRDQIVSMIYYIYKQHSWKDFVNLSIDDLIFELIYRGGALWEKVFACKPIWHNMQGIKEFYDLYLPWIHHENICVTTFEKLVGERGGGSDIEQTSEIKKFCAHLNVETSNENIEKIRNNLFGGTTTFRQGIIGAWKKHFKPEHKEAFKKIAGQLLIDLGYEKDFDW